MPRQVIAGAFLRMSIDYFFTICYTMPCLVDWERKLDEETVNFKIRTDGNRKRGTYKAMDTYRCELCAGVPSAYLRFQNCKEKTMETRIALLGIILEDMSQVEKLNGLLHECSQYIIGRMGLPYRDKGVNIISVVLDAPQDVISTLSGKIGMLPGVSAKTLYSKK